MPKIHPTASVDERAELHESVAVGPHCIINGAVRIGEGTKLIANVYLNGPLILGSRNTLYPGVCLGFAPQDRGYDHAAEGAGLIVGDDNVLREHVTMHRATGAQPTTVGHRNYLMTSAHVGHDSVMGDDCTLATSAMLAGHVRVGDQVVIGGSAGIHQFCRVGRLSMLSGVAAISQDLPPFCICYVTRHIGSLNIVGLRRAGLTRHVPDLKKAFRLFFTEHRSRGAALKLIEEQVGDDPLVKEFTTFIRESKRGICNYEGKLDD